MIDIIIPTYNNPKELCDTLLSIGRNDFCNIIVVDDCSSQENHQLYIKMIQSFAKFMSIQLISLDKNCGPGIARQRGLDCSRNEYIMFLDCGDLIYTPHTLKYIHLILQDNPQYYIVYGGYLEETDKLLEYKIHDYMNDIHFHGKVYKKSFLKKYNIHFIEGIASYSNEDSGFNSLCFMALDQEFRKENVNRVLKLDDPIVIWTKNMNSITVKDDCAFYYTQTMGLAINTINSLQNGKNYKFDEDILQRLQYRIMIYYYILYISCCNQRPDLLNECLKGIVYYYKNCFQYEININQELFLELYNSEIQTAYNDINNPFTFSISTMNIVDFLAYLEEIKES